MERTRAKPGMIKPKQDLNLSGQTPHPAAPSPVSGLQRDETGWAPRGLWSHTLQFFYLQHTQPLFGAGYILCPQLSLAEVSGPGITNIQRSPLKSRLHLYNFTGAFQVVLIRTPALLHNARPQLLSENMEQDFITPSVLYLSLPQNLYHRNDIAKFCHLRMKPGPL